MAKVKTAEKKTPSKVTFLPTAHYKQYLRMKKTMQECTTEASVCDNCEKMKDMEYHLFEILKIINSGVK